MREPGVLARRFLTKLKDMPPGTWKTVLFTLAFGALPMLMFQKFFVTGDPRLVGLLIIASLMLLLGSLTLLFGRAQATLMSVAVLAVSMLPLRIQLMFDAGLPFRLNVNGFNVTLADLLLGILVGIWLAELLLKGTRPLIWPRRMMLMLLLLWLWDALMIIGTDFPLHGVFLLFSQTKMLILFLFAVNHLTEERHLAWAGGLLCFAVAFQGAFGTLEFLGFTPDMASVGFVDRSIDYRLGSEVVKRSGGTIGHPNNYGMLVMMLLVFGLGLLLKAPLSLRGKLLMAGGLGLGGLGLIFSLSRSSWVGFALGAFTVFILWQRQRSGSWFKGVLYSLFAGSAAFLLLFSASGSFRDRLLGDDHGAGEVRFPLMVIASEMIIDEPLTGIGYNQFTSHILDYDTSLERVYETFPRPVHNIFLLVAAETGIIGLLLFLTPLAYTAWLAFSTFRQGEGWPAAVSLGIFGMLISWSAQHMTNYSYHQTLHYFWLLIAMQIAATRMGKNQEASPLNS